jgi:hypothetical protein
MSGLKFEIDVESLVRQFGSIKKEVEAEVVKAVEGLAIMTHAKVNELARDELKSLSKLYMDNLEFSNPSENFWIVTLKEPALWIEEGRKKDFMDELLRGKSAKTNAKGEKYAIIPFQHNKPPTQQSATAFSIANRIKSELKGRGVSWKKIEKDDQGSPRLGRLHSFNIESARVNPLHKNPLTYGVSVYQTKQKDGSVRRDVMTFRVITEKHKGEGLWIHPGRQGNKLFEKAFEWAEKEFETSILPAVLEKFGGSK